MALEHNTQEFRNTMKALRITETHCDMVIRSKTENISVHKCIVLPRLPDVLSSRATVQVLTGCYPEEVEVDLDLREEDPTVVSCMVQYLYEQTYDSLDKSTVPKSKIRVKAWDKNTNKFWKRDVHRYLSNLKDDDDIYYCIGVLGRYSELLPSGICLVDMSKTEAQDWMVELMTEHAPTTEQPILPPDSGILDHVRVAQFASKYEMYGLLRTATEKFNEEIAHLDVNPYFRAVVRHVYGSQVPVGMKKKVAERFFWYMEDIGIFGDIKAMLKEFPDLAMSVINCRYDHVPIRPDITQP